MTRDDLMEHLYRDGRTLESIGRLYCLSRERIRQILQKRGVQPDISRVVRSQEHAAVRWNETTKNKNKRTQKFYGCDYRVALEINGGRNFSDAQSPTGAYKRQQHSSRSRGIEWKFTLPEWWSIWLASGKWHLRGRHRDEYCMARILDDGPYASGNVHIITSVQNIRDGYVTKPARKRREALSHKSLTPRQKEVAKLAAYGLSPLDIGLQLGIKRQAVQVHLCSIKQKLGAYERYYAEVA